jgi:hypothetical protein
MHRFRECVQSVNLKELAEFYNRWNGLKVPESEYLYCDSQWTIYIGFQHSHLIQND